MKEPYGEGLASHTGPESPVCVAAQTDALICREAVAKR